MLSEERKEVKLLVQQSLQNNMKRMVRRAIFPQEYFVPSDHFKSFTSSSTSKNLPFWSVGVGLLKIFQTWKSGSIPHNYSHYIFVSVFNSPVYTQKHA